MGYIIGSPSLLWLLKTVLYFMTQITFQEESLNLYGAVTLSGSRCILYILLYKKRNHLSFITVDNVSIFRKKMRQLACLKWIFLIMPVKTDHSIFELFIFFISYMCLQIIYFLSSDKSFSCMDSSYIQIALLVLDTY